MAITKVIRDFQWNRCHVLEHKVSFQILRDTSNIHTWQKDTIGEANGWLFDSQCLVEGKMPKKKRDYSSCESNFSNCKPLKSRQKVREEKFDEVVSMLEVFFFAVSRHVRLTLEYSACARQWKFSHFLLCFDNDTQLWWLCFDKIMDTFVHIVYSSLEFLTCLYCT